MFPLKVRLISVTLFESSNVLIDHPLNRYLNYPLAQSLSFSTDIDQIEIP